MVSLPLTPFAPWHAAQTVAALALPASISAACATGATARARDNPRIFFMGLLLCTRTQGYTPNPPRTMPPSATTRQAWSIFSFPVRHATLTARVQRREAPMTILRTLAPFLAAAIALAASPPQAETKHQWVEYNQDGTNLNAYLPYDDKLTATRPPTLALHPPQAMPPKPLSLPEISPHLAYAPFP